MTGEHKVRGKYKVTGRHGEQCDREPDSVDRVDQWSGRGGYLTLLGRCTSYVVYDLDGFSASRQETLSLCVQTVIPWQGSQCRRHRRSQGNALFRSDVPGAEKT